MACCHNTDLPGTHIVTILTQENGGNHPVETSRALQQIDDSVTIHRRHFLPNLHRKTCHHSRPSKHVQCSCLTGRSSATNPPN
jgi:hypothetical protein